MKAAVFNGVHNICIEERKIPEISDNEILIKVSACGICGTDVHIFEGDKGAADCIPPTVLGHEFSGIVEKAGKNVSGFKIGDRVCIDPNNTCNECYYCKQGIAHFCQNMIGYGTTVDGGFAQYCKVHYKQAYKFNDDVTFEEAAMAEPVSCCLHGIDMCDIHPGSTLMIIGGGMIGLIMMQLSKIAGASKIILVEPVESKREIAKKLCADICIDPLNEDIKTVLENAKITRIDTVIECVGLPQTITQAMEFVGNKGTVMMFGLTKPDDEVPIKPFSVFQKEIAIRSSFINPYTIGRAVELINAHRLDLTSMVYKSIYLDEISTVLSDPKERAKGKFIVTPWVD